MMPKVVLVTSASAGLGAATAQTLADAGHITYAGVGSTLRRHSGGPGEPEETAGTHRARPRPVILDIADQRSVSAAVARITAEAGGIDVVIHTMGPMPRGPLESFTPYQLAQIYDAHVLSTQRVNRAVLPQMRERREGLLVWVVSSTHRLDTAFYLALHSEAVTAISHLGASYARELTDFGIETTIVASGALTPDTGRPERMVYPDDTKTLDAYEGVYPGLIDRVDAMLAQRPVTDQDVIETAQAIAGVVACPKGDRPHRIEVEYAG
jgi:NAD(P)-dependent dehydrogenase (short-subunit alcohol dehydrogenase family)